MLATSLSKETRMAEAKSDRRQALELAIAQIERQFGKGSIMRLGAGGPLEEIAVIPTGALSLDVALGVGGLPRGRVTEIYGPESSGKTTLALHVIAEAQRLGGIAAFIDAEHALDPIYAKNLGVSTDELLISQPDTGEQALEIAETLVRSNAVDVIVIDSLAALVPRAELDRHMGDALPGRDQAGHGVDRGSHEGQGREEQARPALPRGRVRRHLRRGHLEGGHDPRRGGRAGPRREVRHLVLAQERADRAGSRQRAEV